MNITELKKQYPEFTGQTAYNTIDLTNKLFGNLLVLYRTTDKSNVSKNRKATWVCECQCEKKTILLKAGIDLRSGHATGCGCTRGNRTKELPAGTIYGYWEIIERVSNHKQDTVYYKCKCTKCNETIEEVSKHHLVDGTSTACTTCRRESMRQANIKQEIDKVYGFLKVKRMATNQEKPRTDKTGIYWVCDCLNCGKSDIVVFGDYLRNGDTSSCGCLVSKNERKIAQILDAHRINYIQQYKFDNLISPTSGYKLPFDFGIVKDDKIQYLIEYDGQQHFSEQHEFAEGKFTVTRQYDLIKNQYCFTHNIPLIRIPYNKKYDLNDLIFETTRFLLTKENEKEYYN